MQLTDPLLHGSDDAIRDKGREVDGMRSAKDLSKMEHRIHPVSCLHSIPCLGPARLIISLDAWI